MLGVRVSIFLSYLVSIEGFAGLAGLYVLQRRKVREKEEKKKRVAPKKPEPASPPPSDAQATIATPGDPERSAGVTANPEAAPAKQ